VPGLSPAHAFVFVYVLKFVTERAARALLAPPRATHHAAREPHVCEGVR
jgi:hypothetical protein